MTSARQQLVKSLKQPTARRAYVDEHIGQEVAFQLRAMRKDRGWTQNMVAEASGTVQEVISKLEDPDYGRFSLSTLKRMAAAFDVDLIVRFAPFSERVDRLEHLDHAYLAVPSFDNDRALVSLSAQIDDVLAGITQAQIIAQPTATSTHPNIINAETRFSGRDATNTPYVVTETAEVRYAKGQ